MLFAVETGIWGGTKEDTETPNQNGGYSSLQNKMADHARNGQQKPKWWRCLSHLIKMVAESFPPKQNGGPSNEMPSRARPLKPNKALNPRLIRQKLQG